MSMDKGINADCLRDQGDDKVGGTHEWGCMTHTCG